MYKTWNQVGSFENQFLVKPSKEKEDKVGKKNAGKYRKKKSGTVNGKKKKKNWNDIWDERWMFCMV